MKLLTLKKRGKFVLGVKTEKGIIDVEASLSVLHSDNIPICMTQVIEDVDKSISNLNGHLDRLKSLDDTSYFVNESELEWGPCVTGPGKIICVGLNYQKHADETNSPYPESPILFNKFNNTLTGHQCDITIPKVTEKLDYEVELGIIIGKETKYVSKENALDSVFGYCTVNDLSARDLQFRTSQWLLGKSCDGFNPVGPYLVTADEVDDPQELNLKTTVNDEIRQNSSTSDMIFSCDEIISYISQYMSLYPGDIILTGTPEGVVMGYPEEHQNYLKHGDKVTVEVEGIGKLTNKFVKEH